MKKLVLAAIGITAAFVVLVNLGSILALVFSALVSYAGFHYYRKSESTSQKMFWGAILLIALFTAISNVPAFLGILAFIGVVYVWRKWKGTDNNNIITNASDDPFVNFERQWNEITK